MDRSSSDARITSHCRNLVNDCLAPSRTNVWGLLTGHSIVKLRLYKGPRCVSACLQASFLRRIDFPAPRRTQIHTSKDFAVIVSINEKKKCIAIRSNSWITRVFCHDKFKFKQCNCILTLGSAIYISRVLSLTYNYTWHYSSTQTSYSIYYVERKRKRKKERGGRHNCYDDNQIG